VTQVRTIARERLTERIGALSPLRVAEVLKRLALVFGWDVLAE
jgi:mRNA-degrading endonuclease toxin of MazEF toxin-antitoxin module